MTICVSASWVGATHLIKDLFLRKVPPDNTTEATTSTTTLRPPNSTHHVLDNSFPQPSTLPLTKDLLQEQSLVRYSSNGGGKDPWSNPRSASLFTAVSSSKLQSNDSKDIDKRGRNFNSGRTDTDDKNQAKDNNKWYSPNSLPPATAKPTVQKSEKQTSNDSSSLNSTLQHISSKLSTGITGYATYGDPVNYIATLF